MVSLSTLMMVDISIYHEHLGSLGSTHWSKIGQIVIDFIPYFKKVSQSEKINVQCQNFQGFQKQLELSSKNQLDYN